MRTKLLSIAAFGVLLFQSGGSDAQSLADRYSKHSCAVVRIQMGDGSAGTGFFVSSTGLLVTAAHVLFNYRFTKNDAGEIQTTITPKGTMSVRFHDGQTKTISGVSLGARDVNNSVNDLAALPTGLTTPCFLPIGADNSVRIGDRLLAIGFPVSSTTGVLYEGFVSSKHSKADLILGVIEGTAEPVRSSVDLMRVQMPITSGASGSPIITDKDEVIGVISSIPLLWTAELTRLIAAMQKNPGGSGILLSGFDTTVILAELALIVKEWESPGSGLAVPLSLLKLP